MIMYDLDSKIDNINIERRRVSFQRIQELGYERYCMQLVYIFFHTKSEQVLQHTSDAALLPPWPFLLHNHRVFFGFLIFIFRSQLHDFLSCFPFRCTLWTYLFHFFSSQRGDSIGACVGASVKPTVVSQFIPLVPSSM